MHNAIYLDNAATTKALPSVCHAVDQVLSHTYGNPSSLHTIGLHAEDILTAARRELAGLLGVAAGDIIFTSGGTEADNMAVFGIAHAYQRRGRHIITSAVEHAALLSPSQALEKLGWRITRVEVDDTGYVSPAKVGAAVEDDTVLVSIMSVNNEVGTKQPIAEIVQAVRAKKRDVIIHTDAVQALGKIPLNPQQLGVDMLSLSAHKIHGPKGCGALWVRQGVRLEPLFYGGLQEGGRRPGTENMPGIAGFTAALKEISKHNAADLGAMRSALIEGIQNNVPGAILNGPNSAQAAPHICNFSFPGMRAEVLVHALAQKGVYVSTGAACSSIHKKTSHVLKAMGLPEERINGSLRFSLSWLNTLDEVEMAAHLVGQTVAELGGLKESE